MTEERKIQIPVVADNQTKEGFDSVKQGAREMAQAVQQSGAQASKGVDGVTAATEKLSASQSRIVESIKRQSIGFTEGKAGLAAYRAEQAGVAASAAPYIAKIRLAEQGTTQLGISAKQTAFAMRGVPAQFTDIFTSIAAGQNPLQVFLQQGGQLKDMFGGIGPAARALGGYVAGLINPFTVAAAAVGVLTVAYLQGSKEARAFDNALTASGNAIGITSSRFAQLRDSLIDVAGTKSKAAEALTEIASAGVFTSGSLKGIAEAAILMEKATGQAISKTVDQFKELAKSPADASAKLNEQYNYLTAAIYRQIKALEDQGRAVDAANLAEKTYADALAARGRQIVENVGYIEAKFRSLAFYAKKGWDAVVDIGRAETGGEQLAALKKRAAMLEGNGVKVPQSGPTSYAEADLARTRAQIALLERLNGAQEKQTAAVAERTALEKLGIQFAKDGDAFLDKKAQKERELAKARVEGQKLVNAGLITEADLAKRIQDINKKFEDKGAISSAAAAKRKAEREAEQLAKATLGLDIEQIRAGGERIVAAYAQSEQALEAMRAVGMVSEAEYYEGKRRLLDADSQARQGALEKEIARVQEEARVKKLTGDDLVNNQKAVAKLQGDLAKEREKATSKQTALSNQEALAADKVKRAYEDAAIAAASYIAAISRNAAREDAGIGIGNQTRSELAGRFAIDDKFAAEMQRRESELRNRQITEDQYEDYLKLARFTYSQEVKAYEERTAKMQAVAMDWANGAREALANYADEAANISKQTEAAVGNAFQGMEDALVSFATTGKLSFKDLANSIIADIARMVIKSQITGPLANYLNTALSGMGGFSSYASLGGGAGNYNFGGGFAKGGVFNSPSLSAYSGQVVSQPTLFAFARGAGLMGEAGPEAIMPLKRGPDGRLGVEAAGGGGTTNLYLTVQTDNLVSKTELDAKLRDSSRRMAAALDRRERYGRG